MNMINITNSLEISSKNDEVNDQQLILDSANKLKPLYRQQRSNSSSLLHRNQSIKKIKRPKSSRQKSRKHRKNITMFNNISNILTNDIDDGEVDKLLSLDNEILVPLPTPSSSIVQTTIGVNLERSKSLDSNMNVSVKNNNNENSIVAKECSNENLQKDLGVSCLKKSINQTHHLNDNTTESRHFSVEPMMKINDDVNEIKPKSFHTPADKARFMLGLRASNQRQRINNKPARRYKNRIPTNRNPFLSASNKANNVPKIEDDPEMREYLDTLKNLKANLGILNAQSSNIKQRTKLLYGEARRRKMILFDRLLLETNRIITEKREKTKRAMDQIETTMNRICKQQELKAYNNFRRNIRLVNQKYDRFPNGMLKPKPKIPEIDPKQIKQLMMNSMKQSKEMMNIIKELNETLDEFEVQFNMPRFEPNTIIDQYLKDIEL